MSRRSISSFVSSVGLGAVLLVASPAAAQTPLPESGSPRPLEAHAQTYLTVDLISNSVRSAIAGGYFGTRGASCEVGTHAFVARYDDGDTESWRRYAGSATPDLCPPGESCDLLEGFTLFDPSYIVGSEIQSVDYDPETGHTLAAGILSLAWSGPSCLESFSAQGAFTVQLGPDGVPRTHSYLGSLPTGTPLSQSGCPFSCPDPAIDSPPGITAAPEIQIRPPEVDITTDGSVRLVLEELFEEGAAPRRRLIELSRDLEEVRLIGSMPPEPGEAEALATPITTAAQVAPPAGIPSQLTVRAGRAASGDVRSLGTADHRYLVLDPEIREGSAIVEIDLRLLLEPGSLCLYVAVDVQTILRVRIKPAGGQPAPMAIATLYSTETLGDSDNLVAFPMDLLTEVGGLPFQAGDPATLILEFVADSSDTSGAPGALFAKAEATPPRTSIDLASIQIKP